MGADLRAVPLSVETSPATATADRLAVLAERGATRVSIGVQSFLDAEARAAAGRSGGRRSRRRSAAIRGRRRPDAQHRPDLRHRRADRGDAGAYSLDAALAWRPEEIYLYPLYVRPLTGLGRRAAPRRTGVGRRSGWRLLPAGPRPSARRTATSRCRCGCSAAPTLPAGTRPTTAARTTAWSGSAAAPARTPRRCTTRSTTRSACRQVRAIIDDYSAPGRRLRVAEYGSGSTRTSSAAASCSSRCCRPTGSTVGGLPRAVRRPTPRRRLPGGLDVLGRPGLARADAGPGWCASPPRGWSTPTRSARGSFSRPVRAAMARVRAAMTAMNLTRSSTAGRWPAATTTAPTARSPSAATAAEQLRADRAALERFVGWVGADPDGDRLSVLFTPWGEGLVRSWYRRALVELSPPAARASGSPSRPTWLPHRLAGRRRPRHASRCGAPTTPARSPYERFLAKAPRPGRLRRPVQRRRRRAARAPGATRGALRAELPARRLPVGQRRRGPPLRPTPRGRRLDRDRPAVRRTAGTPHPASAGPCRTGETRDLGGRRRHGAPLPLRAGHRSATSTTAPTAPRCAPRRARTTVCDCHIGYVHLETLPLYDVFAGGVLERIPTAPTAAVDLPAPVALFPGGA